MTDKVLRRKSFAFAVKVVKLCRFLQEQSREYILSRQLLKSGTAIGASVREAEQAESRADFIHKLSIGLKEASESDYWLDLLVESEYLNESAVIEIRAEAKELIRILTAIIRTSKGKGGY